MVIAVVLAQYYWSRVKGFIDMLTIYVKFGMCKYVHILKSTIIFKINFTTLETRTLPP